MATKDVTSTIIKIVVASLVVGMMLTLFDIQPQDLMRNLGDTVVDIFNIVVDLVEWSVQYILIGAVVVVPIWLIRVAIRMTKDGLTKNTKD